MVHMRCWHHQFVFGGSWIYVLWESSLHLPPEATQLPRSERWTSGLSIPASDQQSSKTYIVFFFTFTGISLKIPVFFLSQPAISGVKDHGWLQSPSGWRLRSTCHVRGCWRVRLSVCFWALLWDCRAQTCHAAGPKIAGGAFFNMWIPYRNPADRHHFYESNLPKCGSFVF